MRDLFLLDPEITFLNHGSFGACPTPVFAVYQDWQRELERQPVEFLGRRLASLLKEAREHLADYLNCAPDHLVYITNATVGVNTVAKSLPLRPGDEVLTTDHEYGACDYTWQIVCQQRGARYVRQHMALPLAHPEDFVENFWRGVNENTRVIFISHITSVSALIFPIKEIIQRARKAGIITVIDGAHAPGHIPLNLERLDADFYTGNCHKWMCAPKGSAFLYARPEYHGIIDGQTISWGYAPELANMNIFDSFTGDNQFIRRHQFQGTRDFSAYLSVPAAIDFQRSHDWETIREECHALAHDTTNRICALSGLAPIAEHTAYGQMSAIPLPECDTAALKTRLYDEYRIEVPITAFEGHIFVRVSFQGYNTRADADRLVMALSEIFGWSSGF